MACNSIIYIKIYCISEWYLLHSVLVYDVVRQQQIFRSPTRYKMPLTLHLSEPETWQRDSSMVVGAGVAGEQGRRWCVVMADDCSCALHWRTARTSASLPSSRYGDTTCSTAVDCRHSNTSVVANVYTPTSSLRRRRQIFISSSHEEIFWSSCNIKQ